MKAICGANCDECQIFKNNKCRRCMETNGCPFGKKCFIAKYIELGGIEEFEKQKELLIKEINSLCIEGMPKIQELYPLNGSFINLEYKLPNGEKICFLNDDEAYLGNQVECEFNDEEIRKCFAIAVNMNFILISEYEEDGKNSEILLYKKR